MKRVQICGACDCEYVFSAPHVWILFPVIIIICFINLLIIILIIKNVV